MSGPEGTPNGVDRLRRIDRLWRTAQMRAATGAVTQADVLALVEIAKAARDITESIADGEGFRYVGSEDDIDMLDALARAVARLDSGAAE